MSTDILLPPDGAHKKAATTYKILIIGDSNVGKTSLLNRYCDDSFPSSTLIATVGIDYKTKLIDLDNETVKLQIWDTAGQERFRTLTNAYFRGACGAVLLYDITSRDTFSNVAGWMESIEEHGSSNICVAVVGHKADLEEERTVTTDEGRKLAENYDSLFFEVSAKINLKCEETFSRLAARIKIEKESASYVQPSYPTKLDEAVDFNSSSNKKMSSCC